MDLEKIKHELVEASVNYQQALDNLERARALLEAAVEDGVDDDGCLTETASGCWSVINRMGVVYNEKTKLLPSEIGWLLQYVRGTFER